MVKRNTRRPLNKRSPCFFRVFHLDFSIYRPSSGTPKKGKKTKQAGGHFFFFSQVYLPTPFLGCLLLYFTTYCSLSHPESAGISPRRPEISRRASAHREVESAIIDTFIPMSLVVVVACQSVGLFRASKPRAQPTRRTEH